MKKRCLIIIALTFPMFPIMSMAEPFSVVGPRALGMGGASVAAVNDSTAVYWNPAALADDTRAEIRIPAELGAQDHMGLKDKWNRINSVYSLVEAENPAAIDETIRLLSDLDKPNTGTDINGSAGLLISIPLSRSAFAVSALRFEYAGLYPTIDTLHNEPNPTVSGLLGPEPNPNFVADNASAATGIHIVASEPAVSFATSVGDALSIGINAKMIYAESHMTSQTLTSLNFSNFMDNLNDSITRSSKASLDAGILYSVAGNFKIGVVGRNLNGPSFPVEGIVAKKLASGDVTTVTFKDEIKFDPQCRAGVAWQPFKTFTLAADYDVTRNKTLTPGYEYRSAAVGMEKNFWSENFSLRFGANKNLADSSARTMYTTGLGLRLFDVQFDLAGGYDFDSRQGEVSVDLALRF